MVTRRAVLLAGLVGLTSGSCALLRDALGAAFTRPTLRFTGLQVRDASLAGLTLDTRWQLDNPNGVGLSLASLDYAVFVDGHRVVAGAPPLGLTIPARGSTELTFPATVAFLDLAPALQTVLTRDTATVRVEGTVGLDTPLGRLPLPLAAQATLELPRVPEVRFGAPRLAELSLTSARVEFPLEVASKSSYPLLLQGLTGRVALGGAPLGTLSTGPLGTLSASGTRSLTLPLRVDFLSAGAAVLRTLQGGRTTLAFEAALETPVGPVPLRVEQVVDLAHR